MESITIPIDKQLYFSLLPYELFSEIIKHICDIKTYLSFISTINYRITTDNCFTFKSNILRTYVQSTYAYAHIGKFENIYLLPKDGYKFEVYDYDKQLFLNMIININRIWDLTMYEKIYTDNCGFELSWKPIPFRQNVIKRK